MVREVVSFICRRRRLMHEEAEDFRSWTFIKLMDNDYAILRKYEGRSSLRTYLTVVIERLSIDYQISRWGKWRPSARAQQLGPEAVRLDSLLHRDGYTAHEAVQMLITRKETTLEEDTLMGIASQLPSRPKRNPDRRGIPPTLASPRDGADHTVLEQEREAEMRKLRSALQHAFEDLNHEDRMIARLRFINEWPPNKIAAALQIDVKGLYRRIEHLKRRLRKLLQNQGIEGPPSITED
jgi:RNA polymerase sigma factor for flagellar operon FliA